jgi:hypothetical protein
LRSEMTDLRKESEVVKTPPLTWAASLIITGILCISGIAFAFIGYGAGGGSEKAAPDVDHRPYLLLSTTIDLVIDEDNTSYQVLQLSTLIHLVLVGEVVMDQNITSELRSRASFLYPGANGIALTASAEGAPETTIFGSEGSGEPSLRTATLPSGEGLLIVTLTIWGLTE